MLILVGGGFLAKHISIWAAKNKVPHVVVSRTKIDSFHGQNSSYLSFVSTEEFSSELGDSLIKAATGIIYLISRTVPSDNMEEPWADLELNLIPSVKLFGRIASLNSEAKIVLISSGGTVYGDSVGSPFPEGAAVSPISPYGLGKVMIEDALAYCGRTKNQRYATLRLSNPVGRWHGGGKQGLVAAVIKALLADSPITLYGNTQRDYIDADDVADIIIKVALDEKFNFGTWNIGSGQGTTTLEVVDIISSELGRQPKLNFMSQRACDVELSVLSVESVKRDFNWRATTTLAESVRKIVS